jgi:hypothetical protein
VAAYNKLEGEFATLKRVKEPGFDAVFERFQDDRYYGTCGLKKPPTRRDLLNDMFDDETLVVWELFPEGGDTAVGYLFYVAFDGPPYIEVVFFDGALDLTLARDAMALAVQAFFTHTEEAQLHTFVPQPVSEEVHELLTEGGFDLVEEHPTVDLKKEAAYVMERHTYEAYYGEQEEEETEELDFG